VSLPDAPSDGQRATRRAAGPESLASAGRGGPSHTLAVGCHLPRIAQLGRARWAQKHATGWLPS